MRLRVKCPLASVLAWRALALGADSQGAVAVQSATGRPGPGFRVFAAATKSGGRAGAGARAGVARVVRGPPAARKGLDGLTTGSSSAPQPPPPPPAPPGSREPEIPETLQATTSSNARRHRGSRGARARLSPWSHVPFSQGDCHCWMSCPVEREREFLSSDVMTEFSTACIYLHEVTSPRSSSQTPC
ncbi:uncharacterized protein LOC143661227 [Tamandua tetradactyla]|uniref:uncharacterized protein LOC143661227 n=1 Tax=Tamandua tetradactyla TaxID=48850 RepID=UPI0040549522